MINFVVGTLAAGIAADDVTLTVLAGQGARFVNAIGWPHVIWDASSFSNPADAYWSNATEIVLLTGRTDDTLSITRAQETTTARAFNIAGKTYRIALLLTGGIFQYFGPPATALVRQNFLTGQQEHKIGMHWYPVIAYDDGGNFVLTLDQTPTE